MAADMNYDSNLDSNEEDYESDDGEIFLNEGDVIQEIPIDEEELPDQDEGEMDSDVDLEGPDDSFYVFREHTNELYSVACSPTDPSLVATGGGDDKGFMWKVGSQDSVLELQGHEDSVSTLAFSSDGQFLATGSFDGLIQVWYSNSNSIKCRLEGSGARIEWLKWHPNRHLILAGLGGNCSGLPGSNDYSVWLWDADKSVYLNSFYGHGNKVTCGDFSPDGKYICTGSDDGSLRIWITRTGESRNVEGHPYHTQGLTCLSITHNSTIAITGSIDGSVHMVNIAAGGVSSSLVSHTESVECIGQSPHPHFRWVATGSLDHKLIIWDIEHSSIQCICEHEDGVTCLLWLGMSQHIATGSRDGKVRIWDSHSGSCVHIFRGHTKLVYSLAMTVDQNFLVSISIDRTARVFMISEFK